MEDRFVITESLPPVIDKLSPKFKESNSFSEIQRRQSIKIYGVFDGHGGEVRNNYQAFILYIIVACTIKLIIRTNTILISFLLHYSLQHHM